MEEATSCRSTLMQHRRESRRESEAKLVYLMCCSPELQRLSVGAAEGKRIAVVMKVKTIDFGLLYYYQGCRDTCCPRTRRRADSYSA